jgi:hypothetical protein
MIPSTPKTKKAKGPAQKKKKVATQNGVAKSAPVSKQTSMGYNKPRILSGTNSTGTTSILVSHREFIGTLTSTASTTFQLLGLSANTPGYDGNPACSFLFPWLSNIAGNYEKYRFTKLEFDFKTSNPTTLGGRVYAAWDYDYDDAVVTNIQSLLQNSTSYDGPVWSDFTLKVNTRQMALDQPFRYVSRPTRQDPEPRTAYCGYLMVAAEASNASFGMWVNYTVELCIPCFDNFEVQSIIGSNTFSNSTSAGYRTANFSRIEPGPIRLAVPGVNGVPTVASVGSDPVTALLDIGNARMGTLDLDSCDVVGTLTPTQACPGVMGEVAILDSGGNRLNFMSTIGTTPALKWRTTTGSTLSGAWGTASQPIRTLTSFTLSGLFSVYPQAKYLLPMVFSTTAWQAGNKLWNAYYAL